MILLVRMQMNAPRTKGAEDKDYQDFKRKVFDNLLEPKLSDLSSRILKVA